MFFFTFHFASLIFVNHNETETGGEETREKKRRYMQRLWAATQLCLCVFICVCLCVRVVIALELLWPHVNYISNRGLLLCWARAQEDKHTYTQTQTHMHTHNEQRRQGIVICDGLRFPQPTKHIMWRQTCTQLCPLTL